MVDYKNKFYLILLALFISTNQSASSSDTLSESQAANSTCTSTTSTIVCATAALVVLVLIIAKMAEDGENSVSTNNSSTLDTKVNDYIVKAKTESGLPINENVDSQINNDPALSEKFVQSLVKQLSAGEGIPEDKFNSFISDQNKSSIAENINSATKQLNSISVETKLSVSDLFDLTDSLPSSATANMADAINTVKDTIVKMKADGTYTSDTDITSSDFTSQFAEAAKAIISDATTTGPSNGPTDGPADGPSDDDVSSNIKVGNISGARNPILDTSYQDISLTNTYRQIITRRLGLAKMSKAKVDAKLSELKQSINNLRDQITESDGDTVDIENKLKTTIKEAKATEDYAEDNNNFESDGDPIVITDG